MVLSMVMDWDVYEPHHLTYSKKQKIYAGVIIGIIIIAFVFAFVVPALILSQLNVKVAIIDSGISHQGSLLNRIVSEKSFISTEYGYEVNDTSTSDSSPNGHWHGTYVASVIVENAPYAAIINARVVTSEDHATIAGIIAAIHWAVKEGADVINLSIGGSVTYPHDPLLDAIYWAFSKGVVVVCAAGNDGDYGLGTGNINSPSASPYAISVGAVDESNRIAWYSSIGPAREGYLKPDVVAKGYYTTGLTKVIGTSFATPHVAAVVSNIIHEFKIRNVKYTPGLIKAILLESAVDLGYSDWIQGAGYVENKYALDYANKYYSYTTEVPKLMVVLPSFLPYDFMKLFKGSHFEFYVTVTTSTPTYVYIHKAMDSKNIITVPGHVFVNQTQLVKVEFNVPENISSETYFVDLEFYAVNYTLRHVKAQINFAEPKAIVAFDISHTLWEMDSIYGQFREFYNSLIDENICVEMITNSSEIELSNLMRYDAVIVPDPSSWSIKFDSNYNSELTWANWTDTEIQTYYNYVSAGGSLFIAGLDNESINVKEANRLIAPYGVQFNYDKIPPYTISVNGRVGTYVVSNITIHPITLGVIEFDYYGASLNITGNATALAFAKINSTSDGIHYALNYPVLLAAVNISSGRVVITGTNFFIDNYGLTNNYATSFDKRLTMNIINWLINKK